MKKICGQCKREKSISEFSARKASKDGLQAHCKVCGKTSTNESRKKWSAEKRRQKKTEQRQRFPEKYKARRKLTYELEIGRIKRMPCEICGSKKSHAHHHDYDKPLDVQWLCPKHHYEVHRLMEAK